MSNDKKDSLGNRIKTYESAYKISLPSRFPIIIRLDGKAFHSYTKKCIKPFDKNLNNVMDLTAIKLCEEIQGTQMAYVQSDEISILIHYYKNFNSQSWFNNEIQKMVSVSASIAGATFTINSNKIWETSYKPAYFDSRVFIIPEEDVNNYFYWRQKDCSRNSIQMLARALYSHKECNNKNCEQLKKMCEEAGVSWEEQSNSFKLGRCVTKVKHEKNETIRTKWIIDNNIPNFLNNKFYTQKHLEKNTI